MRRSQLDEGSPGRSPVVGLNVTKDGCAYATKGGKLYYVISISNPTNFVAANIVLVDDVSGNLEDVEFTTDGETWYEWTGLIDIDDMQPGESGDIIIRGKIKDDVENVVTNKATVQTMFCEEEDI